MPVAGVLDVDDLAQPGRGVVVAGLGGELDGAAELGGRRLLVAGGLGRQALLDHLGELRLAGVVRDRGVDAGGERVVVRPAGLDQPVRDDLVADHELDARRELLAADRLRRHPDRDVVVA